MKFCVVLTLLAAFEAVTVTRVSCKEVINVQGQISKLSTATLPLPVALVLRKGAPVTLYVQKGTSCAVVFTATRAKNPWHCITGPLLKGVENGTRGIRAMLKSLNSVQIDVAKAATHYTLKTNRKYISLTSVAALTPGPNVVIKRTRKGVVFRDAIQKQELSVKTSKVVLPFGPQAAGGSDSAGAGDESGDEGGEEGSEEDEEGMME